MAIDAKNYRFRNIYDHSQGYFGITTKMNLTDISDLLYAGYHNGFPVKNIIPLSEFQSLTTEISDYTTISGDINGFSANNTHTQMHIVGTDNSKYAFGFCVVISDDSQIYLKYRLQWMFYSIYDTTPNIWRAVTGAEFQQQGITESLETMYNNIPDYFYLQNSEHREGFGTAFGWYYFDHDENINGYRVVGYMEFLERALIETEENPDPEPTPGNTDPYAPAGSSWYGGGNGNFDISTDNIGVPGLPEVSASDTGFITLFNPSLAQMKNLAQYMWSGLFDIDAFRKIFADPMDCILGLSLVPVDVPSGGSTTVMVGNISTGISMTKASSQYVEVSCGSVDVDEFWGSYLDYEPYTKAEIYLPYVGTHAISIDDIMGKTVSVTYHVDILSGACICYVSAGGSVLYSFMGQCGASIPITGNDWTNVINGALSIAGSIGSMVATGGANAPTQAVNIASTAVNSLKPSIEKSGSLSGAGGLMAIQTPYLIITRPRQAIPQRQNAFMGYPSFVTEFLRDVSGYTEIESIHLEGIPATGAELSEIETILKGGVIL